MGHVDQQDPGGFLDPDVEPTWCGVACADT
jgi:hypothetical protein